MAHRVLHLTNDTGVYQSLGALYYNTGRYQQALATLGGALKRDPYNEEISCIYVSVAAVVACVSGAAVMVCVSVYVMSM